MRADRLVSLVLLLRQRGRMSAESLARELEVSTRTVLRDMEALGAAGVPVYAERGRHGGFALLPGFRTELTGLTPDEATALLVAGTARGERMYGLGSTLAAAMRKVVDALPDSARGAAGDAAQRFLVEPESDLLSRPLVTDPIDSEVLNEVRRAVLAGRRLLIRYAAADSAADVEPAWRIVDPLGLVTVRDRVYLLATREGADRTYRLSRMSGAEALPGAAERPAHVDLDRLWRERTERFLADGHLAVHVRVDPTRRDDLLSSAVAVRSEEPDDARDAWTRLELTFQDARHAEWALWRLGTDAEALAPESVRRALHARASAMAIRYAEAVDVTPHRPHTEQRARGRPASAQPE